MKIIRYQVFCPQCGKEVLIPELRSDEAIRIAAVTGLCQECQDKELLREWLEEQSE